MKQTILLFCLFLVYVESSSQSCFTTNINRSTINVGCNQTCTPLVFQVANIKTPSDYSVTTIPYIPYEYVTPGGTTDNTLYQDDHYSQMFTLPFPFCFYDSIFTKVSVGSNGVLTFDHGLLACPDVSAAYDVSRTIPTNTNLGICAGNWADNYPRASIMAAFMDLDPRAISSPPDRKIEWRVEGTAPCRKFIVSYYHVGTYQQVPCGLNPATSGTFQIVLHEGTSLIDVFFQNRSCPANGGNGSKAILGVQNWDRTKAVTAPGKNATVWTASNEGYRFAPSAGATRFIKSDLFDLAGTFITTASVTDPAAPILDLNFGTYCPPLGISRYVVRTTFSSCSNPSDILMSEDTFRIIRTTDLGATHTATATGCGTPTGTITVTVPPGNGTAPYNYSLDAGAPVSDGDTHTFSGVSAGNHTVTITSGACSSTITATVASESNLAITSAHSTHTACAGASNGSLTVHAGFGTAPFIFTINPSGTVLTSAPGSDSVTFTGLAAGIYNITYSDANGCVTPIPFAAAVFNETGGITGTVAAQPTACTGSNSGTITVTPTNGLAPYVYTISPAAGVLVGNVFTGLPAGNYTITITDAFGCVTNTALAASVTAGNGIVATATTVPATCPGVSNGSITITPANGTAPYTYSISPAVGTQAGNVFNNLPAGNYSITIADGAGCATSTPVSVTVANTTTGITGTVDVFSATCPGVSDGSLTVIPTSGTGPYTFTLNAGTPQASPTFSGLAGGNYNISIQDGVGCTIATPIAITLLNGRGITGTAAAIPATCPGVSNGSVTITPTSGTGPYTFTLNPGAIIQPNNPTFTGLAAATYTATITDNIGCTSEAPISVVINAGNGITASATTTAATCPGVSNGTITATATTGTAPYTYALVPAAGVLTGNVFSNVPAGNYTVVITDATGCTTPSPVTVAVANTSTGITATATSIAATCPTATNGSLTVTPGNGTGPYTYTLMPGNIVQAASTFTGLAPGSYTITVQDNIGCVTATPVSVIITSGTGITASATSTAATCPGVSNGSITATATTGAAPYTYALVPAAGVLTGNVFSNVPAGSYTVVITDATGCTTSSPVTVTVANTNTGITATATTIAATCPTATNGSLTVTPGNGTGPYTYTLMPGNIVQATPTFTGLVPGNYTITVQDNIGCVTATPVSAVITSGTGITASATSTAATCPGVSNGTITATATTGTAPYTYALVPAVGTLTGNVFSNVPAGNYTVVITDANNCTTSSPVAVTVASTTTGITGTATTIAATCPTASNGSLTVAPGNGTGPYTYTLIPGNTTQATPTFTGLIPGNYTITIQDNIGCVTATPVAATITSPAGLSGTIASVPTACPSVNNGSVTITPTSGTGPYTFTLNPGGTQPGNPTFTNLAPGAYTASFTDALGCTPATPLSITVITGSGIITSPVVKTPTTCLGAANGAAIITPTNGTAPFTFVLDGATTQNNVPGAATFTGLATGAHSVTITDALGCQTSTSVTFSIDAGPQITTTATHIDVACNGGNNGFITVAQPATGIAPFEYSLDGLTWQASNLFNGLTAATYTVYFREGNGCTNQLTQVISQPALLAATVAMAPVVCAGQSNGTITVTTTGGTAPYEYSIDGGTNWQTSNVFNLAIGTYTIDVRDARGCTILQQTTTITEPVILTATAITSNATCNGGSNGTVTVTATGGNNNYTYSLNGTTFQASNILNAIAGTYTVTVKDNLGCTTTIPNVVVGLTNDLTFTTPAPVTICEGTSTQLQIVSNALQYAWSPAAGISNPSIANPVANPVVSTSYTVAITYGSCTDNVTVVVNVNPAPVGDAGADGFICFGQNYQLQGAGGNQYSWTPATHLTDATIANPVADPDRTTVYSLIVTDGNGCKSLIADNVIVDVTPPIKITTSPADTIVHTGDQFQVLATSVATNYVWSPSTGLNNPAISNPLITAGAVGDDVIYTVTGTTQAGCRGDGFVRVRVYTGPELYVPTGFTPNGDGKNDKFFPLPVGIKEIKYFKVFNRWGEMMFSTSKLNDGWDGKYGGIDQASGVYVWMVEGISKDNKVITKRGTVMLIR